MTGSFGRFRRTAKFRGTARAAMDPLRQPHRGIHDDVSKGLRPISGERRGRTRRRGCPRASKDVVLFLATKAATKP